MGKEEWRPVVGYEGRYQVSSLGRIRSLKRQGWRKDFLSGHKTKLGYIAINLCGKQKLLHCIVADAFLPIDESKPEVNHKNGIRDDNRLCNLERCSRSENMKHSYRVLHRVLQCWGSPAQIERK